MAPVPNLRLPALRHLITGVAALGALGTGLGMLWFLIEWRVQQYIRRTVAPSTANQCVTIPPTGHYIEGAAPGDWGLIEWRGIERLENCGQPDLTAIIVNGDGIFHAVPLSISGINLDLGLTPVLRYRFQVPDTAEPGRAWFRVTLDFHEAGRTINSPRVHFTILDPDPNPDLTPPANGD